MIDKTNKLFKLNKLPALKILLGVIFGLIVPLIFQVSVQILTTLILFFLILSITFLILKKNLLTFLFGTITIGLLLSWNLRLDQIDFSEKFHTQQLAFFEGKVAKQLNKNNNGNTYLIEGKVDLKDFKKIDSKLLLYIYGNVQFYPNDLIKGKLKIKPANPRQTIYDFADKSYLNSYQANFRAFAFSRDIYLKADNNSVFKDLFKIKEKFKDYIAKIFSERSSKIIIAVLSGDKSNLDPDTREKFSLTGTAHLLAVSGFHIGFISYLLWIFLKLIKNQFLKIFLFSTLIISFVIFTGASPSALRAGLMGIFVIYCLVRQWDFNMLNIFSIAILFSLFISPEQIYSISFQLSVSAVFGIIVFYDIIAEKLFLRRKIQNSILISLVNSISVSMAASVFVAPVSAFYFNSYPVYSVFANLIAIPLMGLVMIFAISSAIFGIISIEFAKDFAFISEILIEIINYFNSIFLSLNSSVIHGETAFILSVSILIAFVYLILSKSLKTFIFRICSLTLVYFLIPKATYDKNEIYNRQFYSAVKINKNQYLISQYKWQYADFPDRNFEQYLNSREVDIFCYDPAYIFNEEFYNNSKNKIIKINKYIESNKMKELIKTAK